MIFRKLFLVLFLFIITQVDAFQLKKSIQKKVYKELVKTFDDKGLSLKPILITNETNSKLSQPIAKDHFAKILKNNNLLGYAYISKAPSKTDFFDYLIFLDKNLIIKKVKILVYREDYGGEIGSKRWLKQFTGKKSGKHLKYTRDIIAISGATISAQSMTVAINNFLRDISILKNQSIL